MSIEVMKQALEFCEFCWRDVPMNEHAFERTEQTIAALRTAIEQAEKQEPVAYKPPAKWTDDEIKDGYRGIRWVTADGVYGRPTDEDIARYLGYNTPPAPQRQPPKFPTMLRKMWSGREVQAWIDEHWQAPPQRLPLTEEEVETLFSDYVEGEHEARFMIDRARNTALEFFTDGVRAIEAAHGITGEKK
jgi:hypothetical protein